MKRGTRLWGVMAVVFCCLWLAMPALAAGQSQKILTDISASELRDILNEMGIVPEVSIDRDGDPLLKIYLGGRVVTTFRSTFFFFRKVTEGRYKDLQMFVAFKRSSKMTEGQLTQKVNEFNRRKRLCKAYVDRDGDVVLESDLTLAGGVTEKTIKVFIENFETLTFNLMAFMQ